MGSGHTQDPRQDSTVTSRVPPEVPDPPSYRVESVSLTTLYQSYYFIFKKFIVNSFIVEILIVSYFILDIFMLDTIIMGYFIK